MTKSEISPAVPPSRETIDVTPTWGEIGNVVMRVALNGETAAIRHMASEIAKAFAAAQAMSAIKDSLTPEQAETAGRVFHEELNKQGFSQEKNG